MRGEEESSQRNKGKRDDIDVRNTREKKKAGNQAKEVTLILLMRAIRGGESWLGRDSELKREWKLVEEGRPRGG